MMKAMKNSFYRFEIKISCGFSMYVRVFHFAKAGAVDLVCNRAWQGGQTNFVGFVLVLIVIKTTKMTHIILHFMVTKN